MGWGGFRSLSLPLFRYTRRQYPSIQRFRPFTMDAAEMKTVNTTRRLRALRELMAQEKYDVNAVIIPSEDQRALQTNPTRTQSLTFCFSRLQRIHRSMRRASGIYLWIRRIRWYYHSTILPQSCSIGCRLRSRYQGKRIFVYRWPIFPSSRKTTGRVTPFYATLS